MVAAGILGALSGCGGPSAAYQSSTATAGNLVLCANSDYAGYGQLLKYGGGLTTTIAFPGAHCQELHIGNVNREISVAIYGLRYGPIARDYLCTGHFNPSSQGLTADLTGTGGSRDECIFHYRH